MSDVGAAEAIDRLLRIADDEQLAGNGRDVLPARLVRIVRRQQQQQLGLQRIGVLELVDEDPREARLEVPPHVRVVAHQIARAQQQIEEVERAVARLQRSRTGRRTRAAPRAAAPRGRRRLELELVERQHQPVARLEHLGARHALGVGRPAALARAPEVAVPAAARRAATPVRRRSLRARGRRRAAQVARCSRRDRRRCRRSRLSPAYDGAWRQVGERVHAASTSASIASAAIERLARPRRRGSRATRVSSKPARRSRSIGPSSSASPGPAAAAGPAQRAPHAFRRVSQAAPGTTRQTLR